MPSIFACRSSLEAGRQIANQQKRGNYEFHFAWGSWASFKDARVPGYAASNQGRPLLAGHENRKMAPLARRSPSALPQRRGVGGNQRDGGAAQSPTGRRFRGRPQRLA